MFTLIEIDSLVENPIANLDKNKILDLVLVKTLGFGPTALGRPTLLMDD